MARPLRAPGRVRVRAPLPVPIVRLPHRRPPGPSRPWPVTPATATAAHRVRRRRKQPPRTGPPRSRTPRPGGCRRFRRRRHPGLPRQTRGRRTPPGCLDRRGLRLLRPTSAARAAARPGPRRRVPARRVGQVASVPAAPVAVRTRLRAVRVPAPEHPARVPAPRAPEHPARVRARRVPARGPATTRSARPRPVWAPRPRPGRRPRALPARVRVRDPRAALQAAPAARVPVDVVPDVLVTAVRAPVARVRVVPGRAR